MPLHSGAGQRAASLGGAGRPPLADAQGRSDDPVLEAGRGLTLEGPRRAVRRGGHARTRPGAALAQEGAALTQRLSAA